MIVHHTPKKEKSGKARDFKPISLENTIGDTRVIKGVFKPSPTEVEDVQSRIAIWNDKLGRWEIDDNNPFSEGGKKTKRKTTKTK